MILESKFIKANKLNAINRIAKMSKINKISKINENNEINKISKINENNEINKIIKINENNGINKIIKINENNGINKINKIIKGIDIEIIKKNAAPMIVCFGMWLAVSLFLLCSIESGIAAIATIILVTIQMIASINDLYNKIIPLKLMISGLIIGLLFFTVFYKSSALIICILGGVAAFVFMKLLIFISKRQVGGGDLALMTVTGFFAGINVFFSILFISMVLTGMYSFFLVFTKKGNKKTEIPFAPFVLLATVICVISGIR